MAEKKYCKNCEEETEVRREKYKDVLELDSVYYTVDLCVCFECSRVHDDETWVE